MLRKYCTCAKRTSWVKQLAGEECKIVLVHVNTYITESFVGYVHTVMCESV